MHNRLAGVYHKVTDMRDEFNRDLRETFLDKKDRAESSPVLLAIATKMAECKAILQAYQLRGLLTAGEIIQVYFIQASRSLNEVLIRSKHLVDLIVDRVVVRSIERGLRAVEKIRKELYLLLMMHHAEPGVPELARQHSQSLAKVKSREADFKREFEQTLSKYRELVPLTLFVDDDQPDAVDAVDEMIDEAEQLADRFGGASDEDRTSVLLAKYVGANVLMDIRMAALKTAGTVQEFGDNQLESVNMTDVQAYEDRMLLAVNTVANYLSEIDTMVGELDSKFDDYIEEVFDRPQQVEDVARNYPLRGVSVFMAEYGALLYCDDRRMLLSIRDAIEDFSADFVHILATDRRPVDILVKRLMKYVGENAQVNNERVLRKRRLFVLLRNYDHFKDVRALARAFANYNINRDQDAFQAGVEINRLVESYRRDTPADRCQQVLAGIDEHFAAVVGKWHDDPGEQRMLKLTLKPELLARIRQARTKASNRILRVKRGDLARMDTNEIRRYELRLLAETVHRRRSQE